MKTILALIAFLLASSIAGAQTPQRLDETLIALYDLDATSFTYCSSAGVGGKVHSDGIPVNIRVTTSGSSTTVAAVTATSAPYQQVAVGDILLFLKTQVQSTPEPEVSGLYVERVVTAKASVDSVTVNAAIQLPAAGTTFYRRPVTCGTAATNGWVPVRNFRSIAFNFMLNQGVFTTGGVDARMECKLEGADSQPVVVDDPPTFLTPGIASRYNCQVPINNAWDFCRVGVKLSGTDDGNDLTTNLEQVTIQFRAVQ